MNQQQYQAQCEKFFSQGDFQSNEILSQKIGKMNATEFKDWQSAMFNEYDKNFEVIRAIIKNIRESEGFKTWEADVDWDKDPLQKEEHKNHVNQYKSIYNGAFEENTAKYDTAETFDVQMIQLEIKASPADEAEAKAQAEKILKEVQGGANFEELATKYSEDGGSASQGGALGWFKKGQMVAPFEEAAFAGEKGKVVPKVVKSDFGYHIIKATGLKGSEVMTFGEVKDKIKAALLKQKQGTAFNSTIEKWKTDLKVKTYEDKL